MVDKFEVGKRYRWIGEVENIPILTLASIPLHDAKVMASGRPILCTYVERDCSNPFVSFEGMDDKQGWAFREYYEYFEEVEEEKEKEMEQDVTQFEVGRSYRYIGEDAGKKVGVKRFESIGINTADAKIIASGKPLKVTKIERSGVKFKECKSKWYFSSLWHLFREVNAQMTYTEAQAEWVRDNNVKAGDSVKLLRAWTHLENGYKGLDGVGAQYDSDKREVHPIGGVFRIVSINDECLCLASDEFDYEIKAGNYFPYFVLEKIAPPKEAEKSTPSTIGVTEFKKGHWYVCHATERPSGWNSRGYMDGLLDGKPHKCTYGEGNLAEFEGIERNGYGGWAFKCADKFEEVPDPTATNFNTYADRQKAWIEANGITEGSEVVVGARAKKGENGWNNNWVEEMSKAIGEVGKVMSLPKEGSSDGIKLLFEGDSPCVGDGPSGYYFPYFVLTKAPKSTGFDVTTDNSSFTPVTEFITGKWYVCHATERPDMFEREGKMDGLLDGKPHLCTKGFGSLASFDVAPRGEGMYSDMWAFNSTIHLFEEVPAPHADVDWEKKYTELEKKYTTLKGKAIAMLSALSDASRDFKEEIESL